LSHGERTAKRCRLHPACAVFTPHPTSPINPPTHQFPFYQLSGKFAAAGALLMDMYTGKPVTLTNDENMQHVWVYDWGSETGRRLFTDFVQAEIASGNVDGMFADKWV